jgi:hypothetical protein
MFSKTCPIPVCDKSFEKTPLYKGVLQKLKRHGNGGNCLKKHEKLQIKIFAERVMKNHIYSSIDFYIGPVCDKSFEKTPLSSLLSGC